MEILGGPIFAVAGAGESHGPGYSTIVYGCPPGIYLTRDTIQTQLNRRRPGSTLHGTPRQEADQVVLLSGIYADDYLALLAGPQITVGDARDQVTQTYAEGYTTGEPIAAMVLSTAKRSGDYSQFAGLKGEVRPGHTDLVKYYQSKGFVDVRGGGRSSYRATVSDVIGGTIARLCLAENFGTVILSALDQVGSLRAPRRLSEEVQDIVQSHSGDRAAITTHINALQEQLIHAPLPGLDGEFTSKARELIETVRTEGDSIGAVVEVVAVNVPALVGEPLYNSLRLRLMGSLGGLNGARYCEIGSGAEVVTRHGSENNDPIRHTGYQSNHHGGMLGGITTGMPIVCRVGFKPTSSIQQAQQSVRKNLEDLDFQLKRGRHDPCLGVRAGVTLESRMAIELLNAALMHATRTIHSEDYRLF